MSDYLIDFHTGVSSKRDKHRSSSQQKLIIDIH